MVARLAPYAPMGHALVSGAVGLVLGTAGAVAMWHLGSHWYPVALAITAFPNSWIGGIAPSGIESNTIERGAVKRTGPHDVGPRTLD
jgi:hypothetical protein